MKCSQPVWVNCPAWRSHSFTGHEPYEPGGLAFPIGRNERIENISAVETQPPVILPRMIVPKMHRDD